MTFADQVIEIAQVDARTGAKKPDILVPASVTGDWAIHQTHLDLGDETWSVTHVPSGMLGARAGSKDDARDVARAAQALTERNGLTGADVNGIVGNDAMRELFAGDVGAPARARTVLALAEAEGVALARARAES